MITVFGCGFFPNTVIMSDYGAQIVRFHPQLLEALRYRPDRVGELSDAEIASALKVKKIYIGSAMYETAKEGQTSSLGSVWGKHIVFAYIPDAPGKYQQSLGYRLGRRNMQPREVYKWPEKNP